MATLSAASEPRPRSVRFWPAPVIVLIAASVVATVFLTLDDPDDPRFFIPVFLAPTTATFLLAIWWFGFSRLRGRVKMLGSAVAVVLELVVGLTTEPTLTPFQWAWTVPLAAILAVVYWSLSSSLTDRRRVAGLLLVVAASAVPWELVRGVGSSGHGDPNLAWRWTQTEEEKYLAAKQALEQGEVSEEPLEVGPDDWVGFRGGDRQGHGPDVELNAEQWENSPPEMLWKHRVGPGWSSFIVVDGHAFTQEQQGANEAVVCYDLHTGATVWEHTKPARFEENMGGPGPRATPTFHDGRLYVMGATGNLSCLKARTGEEAWSLNLAGKYGSPVPMWAFSGSPLVVEDRVIVSAGGAKGQPLLVAFNLTTGEEVWRAGTGMLGHCSPQLTTLDGVEQVLIFAGQGLFGFDPATGDQLWVHSWETLNPEYKISQPQVIDDTSVVIGIGYSYGTKRLRVTRAGDGWSVEQLWHSKRLKPKFNDYVYYDGAIYGFNGDRLVSLDAENGDLNWSGEDYGYGQILLMGDRLLILAESGEVVAVEANPDEFHEIGRFRAIEGKTWNHPVVAEGKLIVRNDAEAACFRLK